MKKGIVVFVLILMITPMVAQNISGGVVAGISRSSVKITEIPNSLSSTIKGENIHGFESGFFLKVNAGPFYGKPEALVNYRSGNVTLTNESGELESKIKLAAVNVPVLFGLELIGPFSIEAGPVYNYTLSMTTLFENEEVSVMKSRVGYRIGANVELWKLLFNVSYQGLKNKSSESSAAFQSPNELIFSIGLKF